MGRALNLSSNLFRFDRWLSSASWVVCFLGYWFSFYFLIEPSVLVLFYFVIGLTTLDALVIFLIFPQVIKGKTILGKDIFGKVNFDRLNQLARVHNGQLIKSIISFPNTLLGYRTGVFILRPCLGGLLFFCFERNHWQELVLPYLCMEFLFFIYSQGIFYLEGYDLSNRIALAIQKANKMVEPMQINPGESKGDITYFPITLGLLLWGMVTLVFFAHRNHEVSQCLKHIWIFAINTLVLAVFGIEKIRNHYLSGLGRILKYLHEIDLNLERTPMPLQGSRVFLTLELAINHLVQKITRHEHAITSWATKASEKSRYEALGQLAGVVVHDLSAAAQTLNYCTQAIREDPARAKDQRYLSQLERSAQQITDLIKSFRIYLRPKHFGQNRCYVRPAFEAAAEMTKVEFIGFFDHEWLVIDPKVNAIEVGMSHADLTHVLHNLIKNSVENFSENKVSNPHIKIVVEDIKPTQKQVTFGIEDNGTGLDPLTFETMTKQSGVGAKSLKSKKGHMSLGLRLIRAMVERQGGTLFIRERKPAEGLGTAYSMTLPAFLN